MSTFAMVLIASVASFVVGWWLRGLRDRCKAKALAARLAASAQPLAKAVAENQPK